MEANSYSKSSSDDTENENKDKKLAPKVRLGGHHEPDKILAATNATGELMFLVKWRNVDDVTIVPAKIANKLYPQVVIEFYENHTEWHK